MLAAESARPFRVTKIKVVSKKREARKAQPAFLARLLLKERTMTKRVLYLAALLLAFSSMPAFGVSKEIVQLQTQVQNLQDQMAQMKQSFDERMGVMKNLIEQSTDNVNKMSIAVDTLQKNLTQQ